MPLIFCAASSSQSGPRTRGPVHYCVSTQIRMILSGLIDSSQHSLLLFNSCTLEESIIIAEVFWLSLLVVSTITLICESFLQQGHFPEQQGS